MHRRRFIVTLGASLAAATAGTGHGAGDAKDARPRIALTMDDITTGASLDTTAEERHGRVREALKRHGNLKAALFVCGKRMDGEEGRRLLGVWDEAGHLIGNHSYTHPYYPSPKVTFESFAEEVVRTEGLIKDYKNFRRLFRFPYLKEGNTAEKRDRMRVFLRERGYRMGYVTIDTSEWYVEQRMTARLKENPKADLGGYKKFYLAHMWERAVFYDDLARRVLNRPVSHALLVHDNLVSALFLTDLLRMFDDKGWRWIDAAEAFAGDAIYRAEPDILPAGESIVWALAKESKRFESLLRYPAEDGEYEKEKMDRLGL